MGCNCNDNVDCGCQVKDLGTKCVIYDGDNLVNLGVNKNTNLKDVLIKLDTIIGQLNN